MVGIKKTMKWSWLHFTSSIWPLWACIFCLKHFEKATNWGTRRIMRPLGTGWKVTLVESALGVIPRPNLSKPCDLLRVPSQQTQVGCSCYNICWHISTKVSVRFWQTPLTWIHGHVFQLGQSAGESNQAQSLWSSNGPINSSLERYKHFVWFFLMWD